MACCQPKPPSCRKVGFCASLPFYGPPDASAWWPHFLSPLDASEWPRLSEWLVTDREFHAWQEQLRHDLTQWEDHNRDTGGLLRGGALATAQQNLGIPQQIAGFVLPLGSTMCMNGTALFEGMTVIFLCQVFGVQLDLAKMIIVIIMSVITAVGAAGVPGGSIPLLVGIAAMFGVPPEGIAIVLGVDRILDMTRTMVNVGGDITATAFVARHEKVWTAADVPAVEGLDLAARDPVTGELVNQGIFPNPLAVLEEWRSPQEVSRFVGSLQARPTNETPTGSPRTNPAGTVMCG